MHRTKFTFGLWRKLRTAGKPRTGCGSYFPSLPGWVVSDTAKFYGIKDLQQATAYLNHPVLGRNLIAIASALLVHEGKTATDIFGHPDDMKLRSSMTLFSQVEGADPVFREVLLKYFGGYLDPATMGLLQN